MSSVVYVYKRAHLRTHKYIYIYIRGQTERVGINRSVVRRGVVASRQAMFVYTEKYVFARVHARASACIPTCVADDADAGRRARLAPGNPTNNRNMVLHATASRCRRPLSDSPMSINRIVLI